MSKFLYFASVAVASLLVLQLAVTDASPQSYYQTPNGQFQTLPQTQKLCGGCPAGYQRETVNGPYCGRCVAPTQSCANGNYLNGNNQCQTCPCPGTSGERRFGTTCRVDTDGQVTCECPNEYTGRDCSQCAPGTVQTNQYPYNCLRLNSTNSFSTTCPVGNRCPQPSIQQIVQPMPQVAYPQPQVAYPQPQPYQPGQCPIVTPVVTPPVTQPCPYVNQTGICPTNPAQGCQPCATTPGAPCPANPYNPPGACPTNPGTVITNPGTGNAQCGCPNPCGCPPGGSGTPGCAVTPPPVVVPPWTPPPVVCPGPIACPPPPPPTVCPQCPPFPPPTVCPPTVCPPISPPQICPPCPAVQCPTTPAVQCPSVCPQVNCPSPCASPCAPCPTIPACPACNLQCPACPVTPPCQSNCDICPNPCQPCPTPCQSCPPIPPCPSCNVSCPKCECDCKAEPIIGVIMEPCICDPRGTALQTGAECSCKVNVQGARCDQCKKGYFALSSTRPEGCLSCFCSGLSDYCTVAPYYRSTIRTSRNADCSIQLTNDQHTEVFTTSSAGFSFDGDTATFTKGANRRLFWSLPACLKGDRVTSYGGLLSFSRMCSGSGSSLGADHEVMLVSGSGATVFWTTFEEQKCSGQWSQIDVLLAESAYWSSGKGEQFRRATRADLMEVLADLQLILIRATFTSNTQTTSIRNVTLSTVTPSASQQGLALHVESCRCPTGYRGLSCENCAPGYYRDTSDVSKSVFGACKPCPCGKTAEGCHLSAGNVICKCKDGFTGPLCQDKEVITITCDPFRIREMEGADIDFTCSFSSNSKRRLLMRLGMEGSSERAEEVTSLTKTIKLTKTLRRVSCEIVDTSNVVWAVVYCAVEIVSDMAVAVPPPPRVIAVIPASTFICVNETDTVTMTCDVHSFGQKKAVIEWRREGSSLVMSTRNEMTIRNAAVDDAGTYICSATDGEVTGVGQIALMVRRSYLLMRSQYPVNATNQLENAIHIRHGGDNPNYPYQADEPQGLDADVSPQILPSTPGHPKAVVEPSEVTARPGDTVILRCNATGEEPLKFYWKSGANDYIPVHVRVSHGALIFRSLRSQDAGVYYCVAWNHLGQSTARATILLDGGLQNSTSVVTAPTIEVLNPETTAKLGENVNLQCRSNTTNARIQWSRIGEEIPKSSEVRSDGILTLYRVSENDKGTYVCTVTAPSGEEVTARAVLTLKTNAEMMIPPRVTISPKSLRVRTGSKVRLECESTGSPAPNVTWVRSIDGTEKRLVSTSLNKVTYEIKQMSKSDVGKYSCNAASAAGRKSESMSLSIDDGQPCKDTEFRCKSGDQCIPRADRCDSEKDCKDGSDELNCGNRRVRRHLKKF